VSFLEKKIDRLYKKCAELTDLGALEWYGNLYFKYRGILGTINVILRENNRGLSKYIDDMAHLIARHGSLQKAPAEAIRRMCLRSHERDHWRKAKGGRSVYHCFFTASVSYDKAIEDYKEMMCRIGREEELNGLT
jgi:hypothetical protein